VNDGRELPNAALSQRSYLRELLARREDIAVYPSNALDSEEPPEKLYFYRPGELLVPGDQLDLFKRVATEISLKYCLAGRTTPKESQEGIAETSAQPPETAAEASLGPATSIPGQGEAQKPEPPPAQIFVRSASELEALIKRLEEASQNKLNVTPNHVLFSSQFWGMDPHGDPTPEANIPPAGDPAGGVSVAVIDTGLPEGYQVNPLLNPVGVGDPALDFETGPYDGRPPLRYPQGHGCFVAGVVRQVAGGAPVTSYLALDDDGIVDEVDLAAVVERALSANPAIVNLSMGTYTRDAQGLITLCRLKSAATTQNVVVVAAAGNSAKSQPFFPAAEDWVISVGAVSLENGTAREATFTNYGPWVDLCAAGVNVLSSYEARPYITQFPPGNVLTFNGSATWSGTSFAAPHVSAVVANMLAATPGLTREEILANLQAGAQAVANLGWYVP
jgi:Subtilase family